jgi:hypothetical protein
MQFRSLCVVVAVLPAALGCYAYAPLDTTTGVQAGEHVAVEITDRGRAELSDRLGSGVLRLEGTLTQSDSVDLVLNVWRVAHFSGQTERWSGESVRIKREYASRVQTRTLNRPRLTWLPVLRLRDWWCSPRRLDCSALQRSRGILQNHPLPNHPAAGGPSRITSWLLTDFPWRQCE